MSDAMTELFAAALGVAAPWRVERVRFEPEAQEIHFDLMCEAKRLPCPRCAAPDQPIHDRQLRDWQHLHFFQYRALLHAAIPRVRCSVCGANGDSEPKFRSSTRNFQLIERAMLNQVNDLARV